jgi:predicted secreted protein
MTTSARIGYGTLFKVRTATGPDVYTSIGEQMNVTPYGISVDAVDGTHMESPDAWREFVAGLVDGGEASSEIHYVPGGAAEALLFSLLRTVAVCRVVFPSGAYVDYSALITGIEVETPLDDKMVASVTWKISGVISPNAASAPTNSVLPAISGVLAVGEVLTAYEGVWANEPTSFTYAWENAGVPIVGATSSTYTVVAGDAGDSITVVVTGTNSAGSASAESAAVVIAA